MPEHTVLLDPRRWVTGLTSLSCLLGQEYYCHFLPWNITGHVLLTPTHPRSLSSFTEVKEGWRNKSLIWVATPGRGHQSWGRDGRKAQTRGSRRQGVGSWSENPSWGGGQCECQASSPGHMLHYPILLHTQDVNLQIKFLRISTPESKVLNTNGGTFLNVCDQSGHKTHENDLGADIQRETKPGTRSSGSWQDSEGST